ncbi:MAG: hypothetical protein ACFFE4_16990 [Candidatus Thorarchaeota archaeon]
MTEIDKSKDDPKASSSGCCPAITVAKIDDLFKKFLDIINEKIGDDKEKAEEWEKNLRRAFFQFKE